MERGDVELFQDENLDILRFMRDYPKIIKLRESGQSNRADPTAGTFSTYDQLYSAIITAYRQNGEADSLIKAIIGNRPKIGSLGLISHRVQYRRRRLSRDFTYLAS